MKKLMTPFLAAGALLLVAGCGGSDDTASSGTPVAAGSSTSAAALTQAGFSAEVQAALAAKKTFQVVTTTTDADGPATFTADVRMAGKAADVSGAGLGSTFVRVGDALYGKGGQLSSDPNKPWAKYDPAAKKPSAILNGAVLRLMAVQLDSYLVVAGSPYATSFGSTPGEPIDGAATTKYTMTVDLPKATAAKAFGQYLTAETIAQTKLTALTVEIVVDQDSLPRTFAYEADGTKITGTFAKFGAPVTIAAPAAGQVA